jgi:hypothetical protein
MRDLTRRSFVGAAAAFATAGPALAQTSGAGLVPYETFGKQRLQIARHPILRRCYGSHYKTDDLAYMHLVLAYDRLQVFPKHFALAVPLPCEVID